MDVNARSIATASRQGAPATNTPLVAEGMALLRSLQSLNLDQRRWVLDHMPRADRQVLEQWLRSEGRAPPPTRWDVGALQTALRLLSKQGQTDTLSLSSRALETTPEPQRPLRLWQRLLGLDTSSRPRPEPALRQIPLQAPKWRNIWQQLARIPMPELGTGGGPEQRLQIALAKAVLQLSKLQPLPLPIRQDTSPQELRQIVIDTLMQETRRIASSWVAYPDIRELSQESGRDINVLIAMAVEQHKRQLEQLSELGLPRAAELLPQPRRPAVLLSLPFGVLSAALEKRRANGLLAWIMVGMGVFLGGLFWYNSG